MTPEPTVRTRIAAVLDRARPDDENAVDRLVPLIYDELRAIAHRQLARERGDHTLQTTALVHEAYLRLAGGGVAGRGRAYFFAAAAQAMRRVLVDRARRRNAARRGGGAEMVALGENDAVVEGFAIELLELDEALRELGRRSPRQVKVVEYRFFGGMSVEDTAEALDVSTRTIESDWAMARAWLFNMLGGAASNGRGERP